MKNVKIPNILIIDDNINTIDVAENALRSTNLYNIFFVTSGEKGLKELSIREHSLILLDINMTGVGWYETSQIIQKDAKYKNIPIIFLSENACKENIKKGYSYGGMDFLKKPFDDEELLYRVSIHIEIYLTAKDLQNEINNTKNLLEQYKIATDVGSLVVKTDLKGNITYVNDKFCETSQYKRSELIGESLNITRSEDISDAVYETLCNTIESKKIWNGVLKNKAKDGSIYYVETNIIPILNSKNDIVEYISVKKDITKEIKLNEDILASQMEILHTLGELGEVRSKETGDHVNRVSLFSELIAKEYGCSNKEAQLLKMASPMHDIGKVIIPDSILLKPAKLTQEEFECMKNHTTYGYEIFAKSKHELLQTAALVAHEHHEKWDGTGYPRGLKGKETHIFARITAIADVFDALTNNRVYKKAWSIEETIELIKSEKNKAFEPKLVDVFLKNIDKILKIKKQYSK